ncbi:MAG: sulfatase-like hydrolase/transferase [Opitutales bacterium]
MARPNVIVFFTDQQRWDSMAAHGCPLDLTPNLDAAAREGTFLKHLVTCQPVCGPARACFQSGQYATRTGCYRNALPLPRNCPTLAGAFNEAGYRTGYIGKWHLADRDIEGPVPEADRAGYRHWLAANVLEFTSEAYQTRFWNEQNEAVDLPGYRVDAQTDAAIRWIDAWSREEEPFFLFLSYIEPHHQNRIDDYPPPRGYRQRYTGRWTPPDLAALGGSSQQHLAGYWGMIRRLDEAYGRLRDALFSLGIEDNTIVLFTTDHGCHFRTRNDEYKRSCHESSIRLPGVITGPGFQGGGTVDKVTSLIDLPPTLLDAAGIDIPDTFDGRSIHQYIQHPAGRADWTDEAFVQISEAESGRALTTSRWKYGVTADWEDSPSSSVYREAHLYDLESDPYELCNLVDLQSHAEVCRRLRQRLLAHIAQVEGERPEIQPVGSRTSGQRFVRPEEFPDEA